VDCDAEVPDLFLGFLLVGVGRRREEKGEAYALAGEDAEGFAVDCVASSEDFVEHPRQRNLLVTLSVRRWNEQSRW
jgi:hypothetical protein